MKKPRTTRHDGAHPAIRHARGHPSPAMAFGRQAVSVATMQRIDEAAIEVFGIPRLLLMDHAGAALARAAADRMAQIHGAVVVCCGLGYNGGDGLCAAWHLLRLGHQPRVAVAGSLDRLRDEPAVYARILQALRIPLIEVLAEDQVASITPWLRKAHVLIDALLGIGLEGPVRPLAAKLITSMNDADTPIIAADVPSGLDADTGLPRGLAIRATVTVTFGVPKRGFFLGQGPAHVGELIVEDLGIPARLLTSPP